MLQNATTECNYHHMLSNQMTEKESWKMILSKFLLNNQISSNQRNNDDPTEGTEPQKMPDKDNLKTNHHHHNQSYTGKEGGLKSVKAISEKSCETHSTAHTYPDPLTPISNNTQTSNSTVQRPKSSISQESWPNTSDDGSNASRQTPDSSSLEEYPAKSTNEFPFSYSVNENKPKFLQSLLTGEDPNQIRSFSSLLTSRVAMASHFDAIISAEDRLSDEESKQLKPQTRSLILERNNNNISCETNNIDEMLLYLLKFLRKKMENINDSKEDPLMMMNRNSESSLDAKNSSIEDDGSLLCGLINEDSSNFNKLPNLNTYDTYIISGMSLNDLKMTRKKISDEYSCLFKVAGAKTMISKNLEAKLTILDLVRTNTKLVFEKITKSSSDINSRMKLPKWIVDLFEGVLDERFTIINNDKKIFDLLQSAVISQDCYPKIITLSCSTIMDNLRNYLLEIGSGERFIDYLLFMTNLNSINYYHIQTLYNSIFPCSSSNIKKRAERPENIQFLFNQNLPLEHRRKRRASRQFNDQEIS